MGLVGAVALGVVILVVCKWTAQAQSVAAEFPSDETVRIELKDGSILHGTVGVKQFEVETVYGKLAVPLSEIIRVRIGKMVDSDVKARIGKLIAELGAASYTVREEAQRQLAELGALARSELEEATECEDAEIAKRASELLVGLSREEDGQPAEDEVEAKAFLIRGKVKFDFLPVLTKQGELKVSKKDILIVTTGVAKHRESKYVLVFDDSTARGVVPHDEELNPGTRDFSVVAFFKSTKPPADDSVIMTKTTSGAPPRGWAICALNSVLYFCVSTKDARFAYKGAFDGAWHSQAMVRESGIVYCYFDGVEVGRFTADGVAADNVGLFFGHLTIPNNHDASFVGRMRNCSYWRRALSPQEVAAIAKGGGALRGTERGLVAYWPMGDGKGNIFRDVVGKRHGTLGGNFRWETTGGAKKHSGNGGA